jgi:hypothetical protein
MQLFIINRDMNVVATSATESKDSIFIDDSSKGQSITLTNGVAIGEYDFVTDPRHEDSKYIVAGNFVAFKDKYNRYRMYTIMSTDSEDIMDVHAEDIGLDLINGIIGSWDYTGNAQTIKQYIDMVALDSDWTVVVDSDIASEKRELSFSGYETRLKRLEDAISSFGFECDFEIKMEGSKVTSNIIHIQKTIGRGIVTNKFINDINLKSFKYSNDISGLYNCVIPTGSNNVTITDIEYNDGRFVSVKGDNRLFDTQSRTKWYRYRYHSNTQLGLYDGYISATKSYSDATTPIQLFDDALRELKSSSDIQISAEANVVDLDADLGDYVEIEDTTNYANIYLKARVQAVQNHYTVDMEDTGTLANYEIMAPNPATSLETMLKELINAQVSIIAWDVTYQVGNSGTVAPTGAWKHEIPEIPSGKFLWTKTVLTMTGGSTSTAYSVSNSTKGATGKGIKSITSHFGLSTSATVEPTSWSTTVLQMTSTNRYLWNYTVITFDDDTTTETTHCVIGVFGDKGKDGVGIETIIEYYAVNNQIDVKPTTWDTQVKTTSSSNRYLWNYELINYTDGKSVSSDPRVIGTYGDTGLGITSIEDHYLATDAYAGVTTYTPGWTTDPQNPSKDKNFLWMYHKIIYTDSSYTISAPVIIGKWSADGVGIVNTVEYYLATILDKGVTIDSTGWTPTLQYADEIKKYVWTYEEVTYSDTTVRNGTPHILNMYSEPGKRGSIIWTSMVEPTVPNYTFNISDLSNTKEIGAPLIGDTIFCNYYYYTITGIGSTTVLTNNKTSFRGETGATGAIGPKGSDGVAGKDGVGIKSTAITYQASTSGTTAPTGAWVPSPNAVAGQYQWTRTIWTYTDGTTETGYSVGHIGTNGATGKDGIAGKDGVGINSTTITYQGGTSGTVQPTGTWVDNPPSVSGGNYLWTRTVWGYTDGTSETGYSIAKVGEKGDKGDQGIAGPKGATGVGINTLVPEYYISNSNEELAGGIWTDPTAYIWSSNVDPVAPDFTFTISNLVSTSVTRSPIVGDVIFCKEKYYTVSSISGTTLLATKKNNLMPSLATDYVFNQTDLKPYDSSVTDTTPSIYDTINCGFTKYSINSILGTTVVSNLSYTNLSPKWTTEYMFKVSDLTHVDTTLTDTPVIGDVIRSKIAANGVESNVFYKISRLSSDNLTVYGSLIIDSSTAKWIAETIDWIKPQINNKYLWTRQHAIYNDGTEEYSNGIFDTNYTDLYSITTSNSSKIESTNSKISNTVTSVQTTKSLLDDLTGIVGQNSTDTNTRLKDLADSTKGVSDSLADYKKTTDDRVTTLETSSTQTATAFTDMVTKTNDLGEKVALASQMLDATGVHVKTSGSQTTSNIDGDGINVTDTDGNMIVEFTYLKSRAAYLDVLEHLSFGAHRAEMLKDTDLDGTEVEGTAFFWIGDVK